MDEELLEPTNDEVQDLDSDEVYTMDVESDYEEDEHELKLVDVTRRYERVYFNRVDGTFFFFDFATEEIARNVVESFYAKKQEEQDD